VRWEDEIALSVAEILPEFICFAAPEPDYETVHRLMYSKRK